MSTPAPMLPPEFAAFSRRVLESPELHAKLADAPGTEVFIERAVALGAEEGFRFQAGDVRAAIDLARRSWMERTLD